jgi:hypothetical protein
MNLTFTNEQLYPERAPHCAGNVYRCELGFCAGDYFLLSHNDSKVHLVSLEGYGVYWKWPVHVNDIFNISNEEIKKVFGHGQFTYVGRIGDFIKNVSK